MTGELERWSRNEIEEFIESLGGKVSSSVSRKTDYVIVGINPGSKYAKAQKLGVKTLNEEEFVKLVQERAKQTGEKVEIPEKKGPMTLF